jgi:uncharacterized protein with NAD-binding domain and iron-sulfur cluster
MGGLAAAWELTRPGARERCDVTVFQLGWRLGGKAASSRNHQLGDRIEEHGLHLLGGCYENVFMMIREAYEELGRHRDAPLAAWRDAFLPQDLVVLEDRAGDRWHHWPQRFPRLPSSPGEHGTISSPLETFTSLIRWLLGVVVAPDPTARWAPPADAHLPEVRGELQVILHDLVARIGYVSDVLRKGPLPSMHRKLAYLVDKLRDAVRLAFVRRTQDPEMRRIWLTLDFLASNVVGILHEGFLIPKRGPVSDLDHPEWLENVAAIDGQDYRKWLARHGASRETLDAPMIRGTGDAVFNSGLEGAAGTALNGLFRLNLTYRGSLFYRMAAGTGETIFAPLYLVLKRRGVDFRFFHRLDRLELDRDGVLAKVHLTRQAKTKSADYLPLIDLRIAGGRLPCWRAQPDWAQLEDGDLLSRSGVDLESTARVPGESSFAIDDFDAVILAVPVGALRTITEELMRDERWRAMVHGMKTTRTQALQLWFDRSLAELGWPYEPPVTTGYAESLDTWADMGHLTRVENDPRVRDIAYFCGSLDDDGSDEEQLERVRSEGRRWLEQNLRHLLPNAGSAVGEYWRANVKPSERYVLSLPGTMHLRMKAHESGVPKLYLAGDWVRTGMNVGSVEAAAMAGKQAARAISGRTIAIPGDVD